MEDAPLEEKEEERRKYTRFKVKDGTFAFSKAIPYEIIDICEAGMSVRTLNCEQRNAKPVVFDLFAADKNNYLPQISSTIVNEVAIFPSPMFSVFPSTRWCIQFHELDDEEKAQLSNFIGEISVSVLFE